MNPSNKKISIVIPSFNQVDFVEMTLRSVISQEYPNKEIIFVDGGSTDGTLDVVEKYRSEIDIYISEKDSGQAEAIAKGFNLASGEIFGWINTDDMYLAGALECVASEFEKHSDINFFVGDTIIIDANGRMHRNRLGLPVCNIGSACTIERSVIWGSGYNQPASFWKKDAYLQYGGIRKDLKFCMDRCNELELLSIGKCAHIDKFLAAFRVHDKSKTSNLQSIKAEEDRLLEKEFGLDNYTYLKRLYVKSSSQFAWRIRNLRAAISLDFKKYEMETINANN